MFSFEGRQIPAEGELSIAAALVRSGEPAGLFCAIGVCFGCLVSVNAGPPERGCVTVAQEGDVVSRAI
ncbi:hypothetical protein Rhe02_48470 [Rhizocola hellebori]|uniref:(2Fe-2S)-binding protein n=1 Tax=Rhizocola hellebori TaxID=1392758 RepID=A0A8J3QA74_9ACTN|nr:2Fe-2S iron-sulfur cluster-binding protein [Rhizocola hellebori]GIH06780.1 hypothetical protein Rhe02_48470 [Rhizocola hellebori]